MKIIVIAALIGTSILVWEFCWILIDDLKKKPTKERGPDEE